MTPEQAPGDVRTVLIDVIGAKGAPSADICMVMRFEADLELESDEFVKLCAILIGHHGDRINFMHTLAGKDLNEIIAMTVGEVVTSIAACLHSSTAVSVDA